MGSDSAISHSEGDLSVPVPRGYKDQMLMPKMPAIFRITELNGWKQLSYYLGGTQVQLWLVLEIMGLKNR